MFRLAPTRRLISGVAGWRCVQQVGGAPGCTAKTPPRSRPPRLASTPILMEARSLSLGAPRLCRGDPQASPGDDSGGFGLKSVGGAPRPALYLGFSGLVPFVSAPLLMAATQSFHPEVAFAQVAYGASIVSFLGGARWGFALPPGSPARPDWVNLGNSVVPSLLAWLALLCRDDVTEGALVVVMGLGLSLHYDLTLLPGYPPWFKAMRTILTLVATFSLVATLAIKRLCPEREIEASRD